MAQPRIEKYLLALSKGEMQRLEEKIAAGKRDSLKTLLKILVAATKKDKEADKKAVFKRVFGRVYSDKEDYLLRNEYRLLVNKVQEVLAEEAQLRECRENPAVFDIALLRELMKKQLWLEFESAYKKAVERAQKEHDYKTLCILHDTYFAYLMVKKEARYDIFAESHDLLLQQLHYYKLYYRAEIAHNQSRRVVCEHLMQATNTSVTITPTHVGIDTAFDDVHSPLINFFEAKAHTFRATGAERIRHAHTAVDNLAALHSEQYRAEQTVALANLGLAYYLHQQFSEAREYYQKAIDYARANKQAIDIALIFNYVSSLIKLKEYHETLSVIEQHRSAIDKAPHVLFRFECFRSFSHIFLCEPEEAFSSIPANIAQRPEAEHHYFRFALLIIPYLRGDADDALRESTNFAKYFHRNKDKIGLSHELVLVTMYKRFFTAVLTPPGTKRKRMLQQLVAMQREFTENHIAYVDYLPFVWLREQTEREIAQQ